MISPFFDLINDINCKCPEMFYLLFKLMLNFRYLVGIPFEFTKSSLDSGNTLLPGLNRRINLVIKPRLLPNLLLNPHHKPINIRLLHQRQYRKVDKMIGHFGARQEVLKLLQHIQINPTIKYKITDGPVSTDRRARLSFRSRFWI